jgi:hypothetical protein
VANDFVRYLTDEALADRLRKVADNARTWSKAERDAFMLEAARRLDRTQLVTKSGKVLTDADIEALADEAERGYDVSHLVGKPDRRKVWVVELPDGLDTVPAGGQVMIEQFGNAPPSIAIRRDRWAVWGPPKRSEVAP